MQKVKINFDMRKSTKSSNHFTFGEVLNLKDLDPKYKKILEKNNNLYIGSQDYWHGKNKGSLLKKDAIIWVKIGYGETMCGDNVYGWILCDDKTKVKADFWMTIRDKSEEDKKEQIKKDKNEQIRIKNDVWERFHKINEDILKCFKEVAKRGLYITLDTYFEPISKKLKETGNIPLDSDLIVKIDSDTMEEINRLIKLPSSITICGVDCKINYNKHYVNIPSRKGHIAGRDDFPNDIISPDGSNKKLKISSFYIGRYLIREDYPKKIKDSSKKILKYKAFTKFKKANEHVKLPIDMEKYPGIQEVTFEYKNILYNFFTLPAICHKETSRCKRNEKGNLLGTIRIKYSVFEWTNYKNKEDALENEEFLDSLINFDKYYQSYVTYTIENADYEKKEKIVIAKLSKDQRNFWKRIAEDKKSYESTLNFDELNTHKNIPHPYKVRDGYLVVALEEYHEDEGFKIRLRETETKAIELYNWTIERCIGLNNFKNNKPLYDRINEIIKRSDYLNTYNGYVDHQHNGRTSGKYRLWESFYEEKKPLNEIINRYKASRTSTYKDNRKEFSIIIENMEIELDKIETLIKKVKHDEDYLPKKVEKNRDKLTVYKQRVDRLISYKKWDELNSLLNSILK
jgi:hypothetical protein